MQRTAYKNGGGPAIRLTHARRGERSPDHALEMEPLSQRVKLLLDQLGQLDPLELLNLEKTVYKQQTNKRRILDPIILWPLVPVPQPA